MPRNRRPKFRRAPPLVRREELVEATLTCLRRFGHDGMSIRRISAQAGVSAGLINHHFPSITTLVAAAYETLATSLLQAIRRHAKNAALTPRQRLRRFFEASFAPDQIDPDLFYIWLVFWSRVRHDAQMRAVHDRTYGAYRAVLEHLLSQLHAAAPPFRLRDASLALGALLDGLWLEASLSPATFRPALAVRMCEAWTDALCAGALPGVRGGQKRLGKKR
jgi:AcrR family transcriptional regulator